MNILVSIVTYKNNINILKKVINTIQQYSNSTLTISIFDNSSSLNIKSLAKELECHYFSSSNIGFGAGHNKNVEYMSKIYIFNFILFLNPDLFITSSQIETLISNMKKKTMTLHSPVLLNDDLSQQDFIRKYPTFFNILLRFFNLSKKIKINSNFNIQRSDFVHGACYLLSYKTFLNIGKFDERFFFIL